MRLYSRRIESGDVDTDLLSTLEREQVATARSLGEERCDRVRQHSIEALFGQPAGELWLIDQAEREASQLATMAERFEELRPEVAQLGKLASLQGVNAISTLNDVAPLLFQHTVYKSYPISLLEKGRFDLLTRWLGGLTVHDLSGVDASVCDSIDSWLGALEAQTPLRPNHSTGTTGKLSILPRDEEDLGRFEQVRVRGMVESPFGDEPAKLDALRDGNKPIPIVYPSYRHGRHVAQRMLDGMVRHLGSEDTTYALYNDFNSADVASLAGRVRGASQKGALDEMEITPELLQRFKTSLARQANQAQDQEAFLDRVVSELGGRKVLAFGAAPFLYAWAVLGEARGIEGLFAPESVVTSGGGLKGAKVPSDWQERVERFLGVKLRVGAYGMSELTPGHGTCPHGHYHVSPYAVPFVLDAETGVPLPREGTQTGRYAFFDLLAGSYWGGFVTGDKVTVTWDGCACGRKGPYVHPSIERFSELEGGDDKISCSGSNDAHEEAMSWLTARANEIA
jgi:hypothetical protein